ncbi:uncharacterized protein BN805_00513 [Prevotella sp. CAG:891]|nr:uncharacterized protein BN805_00513 [Prevotella sp. CAG:891]
MIDGRFVGVVVVARQGVVTAQGHVKGISAVSNVGRFRQVVAPLAVEQGARHVFGLLQVGVVGGKTQSQVVRKLPCLLEILRVVAAQIPALAAANVDGLGVVGTGLRVVLNEARQRVDLFVVAQVQLHHLLMLGQIGTQTHRRVVCAQTAQVRVTLARVQRIVVVVVGQSAQQRGFPFVVRVRGVEHSRLRRLEGEVQVRMHQPVATRGKGVEAAAVVVALFVVVNHRNGGFDAPFTQVHFEVHVHFVAGILLFVAVGVCLVEHVAQQFLGHGARGVVAAGEQVQVEEVERRGSVVVVRAVGSRKLHVFAPPLAEVGRKVEAVIVFGFASHLVFAHVGLRVGEVVEVAVGKRVFALFVIIVVCRQINRSLAFQLSAVTGRKFTVEHIGFRGKIVERAYRGDGQQRQTVGVAEQGIERIFEQVVRIGRKHPFAQAFGIPFFFESPLGLDFDERHCVGAQFGLEVSFGAEGVVPRVSEVVRKGAVGTRPENLGGRSGVVPTIVVRQVYVDGHEVVERAPALFAFPGVFVGHGPHLLFAVAQASAASISPEAAVV